MTLKIETRLVADLIPYASNSRTHSDAQVAQIAASIRQFGWTNPILIDGDNTIIAGHGRLLAARKLGMEEVPAIILDHLSKAEQRALLNSSARGALVVDLFGGSGTTMIAAEKHGRHARLMELDPKYCDVIITRWQDFTGKEAIHAETGEALNASR